MRAVFFSLAAFAMLSGCGSKEEVSLKDATPEEVAKAGKGATQLNPGQWETVIKIVSVELPGVSAPMSKGITAKMVGQETKSSQCISKEQAAQPTADMLAGANGTNNCKFETFVIKDGTLSLKLACGKVGEAGAMVMTSSGPYGGDAYTLDTNMTMASPVGQMKIKATNSAKRVGECAAKSAG
jgi:uncharacterized protein YceK